MQILVTGAAGFIGSSLCQKLAATGNSVFALDNFSDYYDKSLKLFRVKELLEPSKIEVVDLDICNKVEISKLIKISSPDVIINLAAQAGVRLPLDQSYKYVDSNLVGFTNVLTESVENRIRYFLYASSSSVYGDQAAIPYTETESNLHQHERLGSLRFTDPGEGQIWRTSE